jgi:hypothetical protein
MTTDQSLDLSSVIESTADSYIRRIIAPHVRSILVHLVEDLENGVERRRRCGGVMELVDGKVVHEHLRKEGKRKAA